MVPADKDVLFGTNNNVVYAQAKGQPLSFWSSVGFGGMTTTAHEVDSQQLSYNFMCTL